MARSISRSVSIQTSARFFFAFSVVTGVSGWMGISDSNTFRSPASTVNAPVMWWLDSS